MIDEKDIRSAKSMFVKELDDRGIGEQYSNEFVGLCINDFRTLHYPERDKNSVLLGWMIPSYRFVIKNSDIDLASVIWKSLISFLATKQFTGSDNPSAVAGIGYAVFSFVINAYNKGILLNDMQCDVLVVMKIIGKPTTLDSILYLLRARGGRYEGIWNIEAVNSIIVSLQNMRMKNGNITSLVGKDSNDNWGCTDI